MHDEDVIHPDRALQDKLEFIYKLRREGDPRGRVNFDDNTHYQALLKALGNPHLHLPPVIHIAGTNGKGSTLATLRAILEETGVRVHMYSSPHLKKFNERLYLAGSDVTDEDLKELLDETFRKNGGRPVTFFEFTTAMAFTAFVRVPADIVLLETGMGGRLDCTNVVPDPLACAITQISWDHMEFLGTNLTQIATEKAGIIKPSRPCVVGPQTEEAVLAGVQDVFDKQAEKLKAPLSVYGQDWVCHENNGQLGFKHGNDFRAYPPPRLPGPHQIHNAGVALAILEQIKKQFPVYDSQIRQGLRTIRWPARLEHILSGAVAENLPHGWELWFDGGHNLEAARVIVEQIRRWQKSDDKPVYIFIGMKEGKDIQGVTRVLEQANVPMYSVSLNDNISEKIDHFVRNSAVIPGKILIMGSLYLYF